MDYPLDSDEINEAVFGPDSDPGSDPGSIGSWGRTFNALVLQNMLTSEVGCISGGIKRSGKREAKENVEEKRSKREC